MGEAEAAKAAEVLAAHQQTALAKQAELVGGRSVPEKFQPARAAVATALAPTTFDLHECPVCLQPIESGTSVLLSGCLHGLCRTCAPQMLGHDAFILDGHLVTGERHHPAAASAVPGVERQL